MNEVKEAEFILQDSPIKLKLIEDITRLNFTGFTFSRLDKDQEIEVPYWVAVEFVTAGKGEIIEERFNMKELAKAHWREALPSSRHLSHIGENFYFNLRRFIEKLQKESRENIEKMKDLEKVYAMAQDIINCRVRKLASLAASNVNPNEVEKNLVFEERN
jgi:hypothetical protein